MVKKEIIIRVASLADIDGIFCLYKRYMFDPYLLTLGDNFVKRYLEKILRNNNSIAFVAENEELVGFIVGTLDRKKIICCLLFDFILFITWLKKTIIYPKHFLKILEFLKYPFLTKINNVKAELLFIAVKPEFRNSKIATAMIKRSLNYMQNAGIKHVEVTVMSNNVPANNILKKIGFINKSKINFLNKNMNLYYFDFLKNLS